MNGKLKITLNAFILVLAFYGILPIARANTPDTVTIQNLLEKARGNLTSHDYTQAEELSLQAKKISEEEGYERGVALAEYMFGNACYKQGKFTLAEETLLQATEKLNVYGRLDERGDVVNLLGLLYLDQGKYYLAENYFQKAADLYEDIPDTLGIVATSLNLGVINHYRANYYKTAEFYHQSLRMAEHVNDTKHMGIILLNLGLLYSVQKDFQKAVTYIRRSMKVYEEADDQRGLAATWKGLGTVYFNSEKMDSSLSAHQRSLDIYEEIQMANGISDQLSNLADIFVETKDYEKAEDYYLRSIHIRKGNNDQFGLISAYLGLGNLWDERKNMPRALQYYDSAASLSQVIGSSWRSSEIRLNIAKVRASHGNYKEAYEAIQEYLLGRDSLYGKEKTNLVYELEAKYESEKKEQEIKSKQAEVRYLQNSNRMFTWLIVLIGIIALLVVSLFISRSRRVKMKAERSIEMEKKNRELAESELKVAEERQKLLSAEIEYKNQELINFAMQITQKNEFIQSLNEELNTIRKEGSGQENLKAIEEIVKANETLTRDREEFDQYVQNVCEGFFIKLSQTYPDISTNDQKLASLIRLNLSSKEISTILNISPKSVDMSRYRLRKKMSLDNKDSLTEVLQSI